MEKHASENQKMADEYEDLKTKNEELWMGSETLKARNETLQTRNEKIMAENQKLGSMNEKLLSMNEKLKAERYDQMVDARAQTPAHEFNGDKICNQDQPQSSTSRKAPLAKNNQPLVIQSKKRKQPLMTQVIPVGTFHFDNLYMSVL